MCRTFDQLQRRHARSVRTVSLHPTAQSGTWQRGTWPDCARARDASLWNFRSQDCNPSFEGDLGALTSGREGEGGQGRCSLRPVDARLAHRVAARAGLLEGHCYSHSSALGSRSELPGLRVTLCSRNLVVLASCRLWCVCVCAFPFRVTFMSLPQRVRVQNASSALRRKRDPTGSGDARAGLQVEHLCLG